MATRVRSFSKINLGLRIGPVRPDGFHGLATLYQTIGLYDVVTVSARQAGATRIAIRTAHGRVPLDGRNTAWQMAERALAAMGVTAEVVIEIEKRLPVQGGLGAGSANAAAALVALERELGLGVSGLSGPGLSGPGSSGGGLSGPERLRLAAEVGSDVPLFLIGGAVLGLGRGEQVVAMPEVALRGADAVGGGVPCVVAVPRVGVSTPMAFREWDRVAGERRARAARDAVIGGESGGSGAAAPDRLTPSSDSGTLEELSLALSSAYALAAGSGAPPKGSLEEREPGPTGIASNVPSGLPEKKQAEGWSDLAENSLLALVRTGIENDFEEVVFSFHPSLRSTKRLLMGEETGQPAVYAALSGSGSALFGLYRTTDDARAAQQRVQASGSEALLTETLPRGEYWARMFDDADSSFPVPGR